MTIFKFLSKYFWVIAFIVSYINYISFKNKSKKYIEKNPELEEGYKKILKQIFTKRIPLGGAVVKYQGRGDNIEKVSCRTMV